MLSIRTWHTYLGILIAPSVLFFALTGALQLFGLHEAHGNYTPPPLIERLGSLHQDQVFVLKDHHADSHPAEDAAAHPPDHAATDDDDAPALRTVLLKWFFLLVAASLVISTSLGLWMGLTHIRHKRVGWWLLAIGVLLPVGLLVV
jgi:hypothetical protein